jgi:flagellin
MTRINTNVASLSALTDLQKSNQAMSTSLARLSSGLRINTAADDPAGLIVSEFLRAEIGSLNQAIDNSERAINIISTAEGGLNEISALLVDVRALVIESASTGGLSEEEIDANQLQIDSAVESISRIANTTSFGDINLLNGNLGIVTSGVDATQIEDLTVYAAQYGQQSSLPVDITVITNADTGRLTYATSDVTSGVTIEVAGREGTEVFSFVSGTAASAILFAVNQMADATGVSASLINAANAASGIHLDSRDYGSSSFVSVKAQSGAFATQDGRTRDEGADAVVELNGQRTFGDGLEVQFNSTVIDLKFKLNSGIADGTALTSFSLVDGGALFQLGSDVTLNQQANVGIQSVTANNLGGSYGRLDQLATGGEYNLRRGNLTSAQRIVDDAISDVTNLRGRLGSFQLNTLETNINSLQVALENITAAESSIRDADFAAETAAMTRNQILVQAGTAVLSIANSSPQSVLSLLG